VRWIIVLFLGANLHPCGFSTFAKAGDVLEPFSCAPREGNVRRRCVKEVQLRCADDREIECPVEGSFASLLQIDGQRIRARVGMPPPGFDF